jgi:amidase
MFPRSPDGLPIGAQLIGGFLEDRATLALAGMIERELGCAFAAPPGY